MEKNSIIQESEQIELKTSTSELKEGLISIVAILNKHKQGTLHWGIKNDGVVVGQDVSEKTLRDISKAISDHIEPKIYPEIKKEIVENKACIRVAFSGDDGPYFAYGRAYMRVVDEDKPLSSAELKKLFFKKAEHSWESGFSDKTLEDVNEATVKEFVERANAAKRIDFKFSDVKSVLSKLNLIRGDRLLKAAEVLFCDNNTLEVQAAVFAGTEKLTFLDIKQFNGNIFNLFEQSEYYIKEHMNWRAELSGSGRKEIPEVPVRAITEALVNSLCHRDYANPKGNEVAVFKNRIEIYNPGQFPDEYEPADFFKGEERSILRNPIIANALYLSKDIERWGSGIRRIYEACKEENVRVEFKRLKSGFLVVFYRKEETAGETTPQVTSQVTSQVTPQVGLTELESKILDEILKNSRISRNEISKNLGLSPDTVKEYIEKLKRKGALKRKGKTSAGYWEVTK